MTAGQPEATAPGADSTWTSRTAAVEVSVRDGDVEARVFMPREEAREWWGVTDVLRAAVGVLVREGPPDLAWELRRLLDDREDPLPSEDHEDDEDDERRQRDEGDDDRAAEPPCDEDEGSES
jgi:hypothetical protein